MNLISVDWQGYVYDCDFNQMLALPLLLGEAANPYAFSGKTRDVQRVHLSELVGVDLEANPIAVAGHCFGCTAGQGSSCGGALN